MKARQDLLNKKRGIFLAFLIAALSSARFLYLGSIPGLHGDEALYGIKTHIMMHGSPFTLIGFNSYTGPIISYLRIAFFYLMGVNIFSLRLPVVILSLFSTFFIYRMLAENYNKTTGIIGLLLFLTMPWSFIYSRFADETHISLIFFAIGGLYYLIGERRLLNRILAGLFLGLGVFEHLIFIIVPIAYFIYFFVKDRFKIKREDVICVLIFSIFLLARLFLVYRAHLFNAEGDGIYYTLAQAFNVNLASKFLYSIPHFMNMIDGSIFYQRTTGNILVDIIPLNSVLFAISFLFILLRRKSQDRMFIFIFIIIYIINAVFLMEFSLRYYMVALMFSGILMAIFIGTAKIKNWFRVGLVSLIVILNCLYISINYMYNFKQSGGRVSYFWSGNYFENSNGFVESGILYDYLKEKGIKYIFVPEGFPRWQIIFHDLKEKRLDIRAKAESVTAAKVYFISYKGDRPPQEYGLNRDYSLTREITPLDNYEIFLAQR